MKPLVSFVVAAFALLFTCGAPALSQDAPKQTSTNAVTRAANLTDLVYVIPIKGIIEPGLLYTVDRSLQKAKSAGATTIVFHMDTPGGMVNITEKLIRMFMALPEGVRTYTFIDKDALSAGALIAVATDEIYMSPGSRIGASAIVTPFGDLEEGDSKEKALSALLALVQYSAKAKGRDPNLIEAMVRKEFEYKIDDEVICPKGQLLTFDNLEATRLIGKEGEQAPILSNGTARNLEELMKLIGKESAKVIKPLLTPSEKLTRYAKLFAVLFLVLGAIGIYMEFKAPGFGIPGVLGIIFLMLFFWARYIAGTAGTVEMLIFIVGLSFLLVEVFIIPGFGAAGITGISLMFLSVFLAMVQHFPGEGYFSLPELQAQGALASMSTALIISFTIMVILTKFLPETALFSHIALKATLSHEKGYEASSSTENLVGMAGYAATPLHPAGIGMFDNKRFDVVAHGEFIEKDALITIAETHGNRIVVKPSSSMQAQNKEENKEKDS